MMNDYLSNMFSDNMIVKILFLATRLGVKVAFLPFDEKNDPYGHWTTNVATRYKTRSRDVWAKASASDSEGAIYGAVKMAVNKALEVDEVKRNLFKEQCERIEMEELERRNNETVYSN